MLSISTIKTSQAAAMSEYYAEKVRSGELTMEEAAEREIEERAEELAEIRGLSLDDARALAHREKLMESGLAATKGAGTYYKADAAEKPRLVWVRGTQPHGARVTNAELLAHLQGVTPDGERALVDPAPQRLDKICRLLGLAEGTLMGGSQLAALREGRHPETGEELAGDVRQVVDRYWAPKEQAGPGKRDVVTTYDLTFSAPKGVSIMMGFGDEELRELIIGLHEEAVDASLGYAEDAGVFAVARGHARSEAIAASPLGAMRKTELASRAGDPQLHSHLLVSAAARGADGRITLLDGQCVFHASKILRARYEAELATRLKEQLGITVAMNPETGVREVVGLHPALLDEYSKRSAQVAEKFAELQRADKLLVKRVEADLITYEELASRRASGVALDAEQSKMADDFAAYEAILRQWASGKTASQTHQRAVLESRDAKAELPEAEQLREWAEAPGRPDVAELLSNAQARSEAVEKKPTVEAVVAAALTHATRDSSVIRQKDLISALHCVWPAGWDISRVAEVEEALMGSSELLQLTDRMDLQAGAWTKGIGTEYTTKTAVAQEQRIEAMAAKLAHSSGGPRLDPRRLAEFAERYTLTPAQEAFLAAAGRGTKLAVAEAPAGAGKTHMLSPLVAAYQEAGYEVVGLSTKADTAAALAEAGVNRHASLARLELWAEEKTWQAGVSNPLALEGEACRTAVRQAETPEQKRAAEAALSDWQQRAAKEPKLRKREWAQLKRDWDEYKAHPPADAAARQQAYDRLSQRSEELGARTPQSWKKADKVVLMLDEAAMTNNTQMEKVLQLAGQRGWAVTMTGDSRQLQGIGRSTAFGLVADAAGRMDVSETYRARDARERELQVGWHDASSLVEGALLEEATAAEAMIDYWREKGRLHIPESSDLEEAARVRPKSRDPFSEAAIERIAEAYVSDELANPEATRLALARTNRQVNQLAEAIQKEQVRRGIINPEERAAKLRDQKRGLEQQIRAGETIRITKNIRRTQIRNGQVGTVIGVRADGAIRVQLPTGVGGAMKTEVIKPRHLEAGHAALGCASTGHGAQGRTVERAWVVADGTADREWLYPAMTRAKAGTDLHWVSEDPERAEQDLSRAMLTTGREASALQVARTHPTPGQQAEAAAWLKARGREVTPEAVLERASLVQAAEASKREQQRAELRVAQTSSAEVVQTIRQQREQKARKQQAQQRHGQGRGMAA